MGTHANITSKRMLQFLRWLGNHKKVDIVSGGVHPTKVMCHNGETYPLPLGHAMLNKHIVKHFCAWLVKNEVCTEQEFNDKL